MIDIEKIKLEIIEKLKPLNPEKVILFGSYAYGTPNEDSDIDLYVVTNDDFMPQTFKENMDIKLRVSRAIKDLQKIIPIDTIIHTKAMNEKFTQIGSMFSKEILSKGIKIYG
jgi:predicted nucleotidyltransferase